MSQQLPLFIPTLRYRYVWGLKSKFDKNFRSEDFSPDIEQ